MGFDDFDQTQTAGEDQYADDGKAKSDFVAHHLRCRSQGSKQRILAVRGPATKNDPKDADRRNGEYIQNADIEIGNDIADLVAHDRKSVRRTERNDRKHDECGNQRDNRRQRKDPLIGSGRNDVFFQHELYSVRKRLEDAVRADPHRTKPDLNPSGDFSFRQC